MDQKQFDARITHQKKALIVELWAPWCGPCRMMEPAIKSAGQKYAGQVDLLRINADLSAELVRKLRVFGIPTMIGYSGGREIFRKTGAQSGKAIESLFERALAGDATVPDRSSQGRLSRALRLLAGAALAGFGWFLGREWLLIAAGAVVAFSAVYDRCPIYQAVMPRIREWIQNR